MNECHLFVNIKHVKESYSSESRGEIEGPRKIKSMRSPLGAISCDIFSRSGVHDPLRSLDPLLGENSQDTELQLSQMNVPLPWLNVNVTCLLNGLLLPFRSSRRLARVCVVVFMLLLSLKQQYMSPSTSPRAHTPSSPTTKYPNLQREDRTIVQENIHQAVQPQITYDLQQITAHQSKITHNQYRNPMQVFQTSQNSEFTDA